METKQKYHYIFNNGRKWYFRLFASEKGKGLYNDISQDLAVGKHIVRLEHKKYNNLFTIFDKHTDLYTFLYKINEYNRCYHETIVGFEQQKPRFDCDIDGTDEKTIKFMNDTQKSLKEIGQLTLNSLIDSLIDFFVSAKLPFQLEKNLIVFTSSRKNKESFHLIIDGFYHNNYLEAKAFYQEIVGKMRYGKNFVDPGPYGSTSYLRLEDNTKLGIRAPKRRMATYQYHNREITTLDPFTESPELLKLRKFEQGLIMLIGDSICIPSLIKEQKEIDFNPVTKEQAKLAMQFLSTTLEIELESPDFPFRYNGTKGNLIKLERLSSTYCRVCEKVHDRHPAIIIVVGKQYRFYCCRSPDKRYILLGISGESNIKTSMAPVLQDTTRKCYYSWELSSSSIYDYFTDLTIDGDNLEDNDDISDEETNDDILDENTDDNEFTEDLVPRNLSSYLVNQQEIASLKLQQFKDNDKFNRSELKHQRESAALQEQNNIISGIFSEKRTSIETSRNTDPFSVPINPEYNLMSQTTLPETSSDGLLKVEELNRPSIIEAIKDLKVDPTPPASFDGLEISEIQKRQEKEQKKDEPVDPNKNITKSSYRDPYSMAIIPDLRLSVSQTEDFSESFLYPISKIRVEGTLTNVWNGITTDRLGDNPKRLEHFRSSSRPTTGSGNSGYQRY